ncbi:MAG TPA: hypothetical protein VHB68_02025 [Steroidobacteraceae bacterium]|nr:hypothetical protein [Steroidobacteraceae bacterium]
MNRTDKPQGTDKPQVQGEGDYEAARRYRKEVKDYVEHADIDKAAREAAPQSEREQGEMEAAEQAGRAHSKAGTERDMSLKPEPKSGR